MPATRVLVSRLESLFHLTAEERDAIAALPSRLVTLAPEQQIHRAGDRPTDCFVLLDGMVSSSRDIEDGKRQIMSFYVRGDMPDLRTLHLGVIDCDVYAVGPGRIAVIDHADLRRICDAHPRISAAFWRSTLVIAAIYREWIVNIGHRSALSRLAHLLCEMMVRHEAAGLARGGVCDLPLTQQHLSAATGLSAVHLNRTMQELRRRGLVVFTTGHLAIPDFPALAALANFNPSYLYITEPLPGAA
jgi:CRP-like cAMP-binding protein